jgi:uncharacterized protein RhaS with RHS repeats
MQPNEGIQPNDEVTYFIHSDRLGTPHAVTDESRRVVWRAE